MIRKYPTTAYKACLLFVLSILLILPSGVCAQGAGLPEELRETSISDSFVPLFAEVVGTVQSVQGRLVVRHGDSQRAYYAAAGNTLYQNDVLYTLEESRCRLQFVTEEVITMGANSQVRVDEVFDNRQNQEKRSIFSMVRGKAMFYALRLFRYKKVDVEVRTPTAVAGIRGTKFGVVVEKVSDKRASSDSIYLADASGDLPRGLLAQVGPLGEGYQTTVYGYDGDVQVTAMADGSTQTVGPGENLTVGAEGAGDISLTPPEESRQFGADTSTPGEEEPGEGEEIGRGEGGEPEEGVTGTAGAENEAEAMDVGQELTSQDMAGDEGGGVVSGSRVGHFTGLLLNLDNGYKFVDIFNTNTRVDFEADEVKADSIANTGGSITLSGTRETSEQGYVKRIKTTGFEGNDLGEGHPFDYEPLAGNTHVTVGELWAAVNGVSEGYPVNDFMGYMVLGEATPDAAASGIKGTYSGDAGGTYFDGSTDLIDLAGGFECYIDVPAKKVTGFDLEVFGSGAYASIRDGSGTFKGGGFSLDANKGTWDLDGNTNLNVKSLVGSLYGPNGDSIGGTWAMGWYFDPAAGAQEGGTGTESVGAVGAFFGDKEEPPEEPEDPPEVPEEPGDWLGYLNALLTVNDGDSKSIVDVYLNSKRKDLDASPGSIESIYGGDGALTHVDDGDDSYIKRIVARNVFDSEDLDPGIAIIDADDDGYEDILEWGHWYMDGWVPGDDSAQYSVSDKGYWIAGEFTPDEVAAGVEGTYSGDAWGTYWNGTGGIDMTGDFDCYIDVSGNEVSDFNLYVSGGGASASITDGKGTFFGSTGGFTLDGTGDWYLRGEISATEKKLSGSLYGPDGDYIGGAWAMANGPFEGAVGLFAGTEGKPTTEPEDPDAWYGYLNALLTKKDGNDYSVADVYLNSERKDLDASPGSIESIFGDGGVLTHVDDGDDSYIKRIVARSVFDSGDLDPALPIYEDGDGSLGEYLEWGFWNMDMFDWVPGSGSAEFSVSDRGYWIAGEVTPNDVVNGVAGTYSGDVWGTYFDGEGGVRMTGDFSCDVDGLRREVSTFKMNAQDSGESVSASITGASGTFIGNTGGFTLDGNSGTWNLQGNSPAEKSLSGSLYGPQGQNIGGGWAMHGDANNAAVGIFAGQINR